MKLKHSKLNNESSENLLLKISKFNDGSSKCSKSKNSIIIQYIYKSSSESQKVYFQKSQR